MTKPIGVQPPYTFKELKMKNGLLHILGAVALCIGFSFMLIFGVDAEAARIDRANGIAPQGCIFDCNCWKGDLQ